jgi:hypothetical protein
MSYLRQTTVSPSFAKSAIDDDERSIEFSVDPKMYEKLGVHKVLVGEQNAFDVEKLYQFQLQKDLEKINKIKGNYQQRVDKFVDRRMRDPLFKQVAAEKSLGKSGKFVELLPLSSRESWMLTSQPYGIIAHKR